jgi:transcriptional regulator with XRE-family HTH domain
VDITQWLVEEVNKRGWSFRELGRRAGLSSGAISKVITGVSLPGWEFCRRVARAFNVPPEKVFRLAGLLPPEPRETTNMREITHLFSQLSPEDQERFIAFVRTFLEPGGDLAQGAVQVQDGVADKKGVRFRERR